MCFIMYFLSEIEDNQLIERYNGIWNRLRAHVYHLYICVYIYIYIYFKNCVTKLQQSGQLVERFISNE